MFASRMNFGALRRHAVDILAAHSYIPISEELTDKFRHNLFIQGRAAKRKFGVFMRPDFQGEGVCFVVIGANYDAIPGVKRDPAERGLKNIWQRLNPKPTIINIPLAAPDVAGILRRRTMALERYREMPLERFITGMGKAPEEAQAIQDFLKPERPPSVVGMIVAAAPAPGKAATAW